MYLDIDKIMEGSYDLHTHSNPSHLKRELNDYELLEKAANYKMKGVMIKNHLESTIGRAKLVNDISKNICTRAYGGIVLNKSVGGINPYAVESSLRLGASFVWMPTIDAKNDIQQRNEKSNILKNPREISILDDNDNLISDIYDILDLVKEYDAVIATGHISVKESIILCKESRKRGIKTVLTHPEWERTFIPVDIQIELSNLGVLIEKVWYNVAEGNCSIEYMSDTIKKISSDRIFMTTDRGQFGKETPAEALIEFAKLLYKNGISEKELEIMMKRNPCNLVSGK